jgi:RNA polymerase sigma factor (sigma-70 family)
VARESVEAGEEFEDGGASFASPAPIGVVAARNGDGPEREVTRRLIEAIAGGVQGARLRSQVAAWNAGATREEVAEAFQEACRLALRSCRGRSEGEVYVWLRTTTHRELGHMRRRAWRRAARERPVDESSASLESAMLSAPGPEDELLERERTAELEELAGAVLAALTEPQREIVALHSRGCRRPEIAERLGVTPRSVKRALERIMALGRAELVRLAGHGCGSGEHLVSRLAFGLASEREIRAALWAFRSTEGSNPSPSALQAAIPHYRVDVASPLSRTRRHRERHSTSLDGTVRAHSGLQPGLWAPRSLSTRARQGETRRGKPGVRNSWPAPAASSR